MNLLNTDVKFKIQRVLITWPRVDMRSFVKYFSTPEDKFRISKRPCNFLFIT